MCIIVGGQDSSKRELGPERRRGQRFERGSGEGPAQVRETVRTQVDVARRQVGGQQVQPKDCPEEAQGQRGRHEGLPERAGKNSL